MNPRMRVLGLGAVLVFVVHVKAQGSATQPAGPIDESQARPPVTMADVQIVKRAREILNSPSKWNRADTRVCPAEARVFSLYCALEKATDEVGGHFEHRGAAMQEARFVIDEIAPNRNYEHRLMGYNNDPATTFADIQRAFRLLEARIAKRLTEEPSKAHASGVNATGATDGLRASPPVTRTDLQIIQRAREILDSPLKWDRADTQQCPSDAKAFSLFCALQTSAHEVSGAFDDSGVVIQEARVVIDETAPKRAKYQARLKDYNNDPTTTFSDIQKLFQIVEERLAHRLAAASGRGK